MLLAGFFLIKQAAAQAATALEQTNFQPASVKTMFSAHDHQMQLTVPQAQAGVANTLNNAPAIRATRRISIPFGFQSPLPILDAGREVVVRGHGGCTAGEQVTVAITITQSTSGAVATGEDEYLCTGKLQTWSSVVTADTTNSFITDAAEACGFATTHDEGNITDTYAWCRDVELAVFDHHVHLPFVINP